eukprot:TRINITY_DN31315_c0_g1_i1.p1 TRINITY_DN31315_c0_g1~~TRINITY_DN31315_c0_g1_i1.p1  ORF type:complete len:278 (-),score=24.58 TRINITY_DN31315_c0_g1_i1:211-1044(-)
MHVAVPSWRNEGLLYVCEALPARNLARLVCTTRSLCTSVTDLWALLRHLRARCLSESPRQFFLRLHRLEQSLLYEEFGDVSWENVWRPDSRVGGSEDSTWHIGEHGLHLSGLSGRTLDFGDVFCPPVAAFSIAAQASATEAAIGYIVLEDAWKRRSAWIYFEWYQDLVGAPGLCLWINDHKHVLMDWPWPDSLKLSFELDWVAKELTEIRINGTRVLRGESIDFHNMECSGVRKISLANRRGAAAKARWEMIQLYAERRNGSSAKTKSRSRFMNMLL